MDSRGPGLPGHTPQLVGDSHWSSMPNKLQTLNRRVGPRHAEAEQGEVGKGQSRPRGLPGCPPPSIGLFATAVQSLGRKRVGGQGEGLLRPRDLPDYHPRATANKL
jgi:hypothetical protein